MSANLDLVRSIYADWERGDFSSVEWADPNIEFVLSDGPDPGTFVGPQAMAERWREQLGPWEDLRVETRECRELDDGQILVSGRMAEFGKASGAPAENSVINVCQVRDGKVVRLTLYWSRDRALADLGLDE